MEGNCNFIYAKRALVNNISKCETCKDDIFMHIDEDGKYTVCFSNCSCGKYKNNSKEMAEKHVLYYP